MELAGVLSNQELADRLGRVRDAVAGLSPGSSPDLPEPPLAQGAVLRAIKAVLADRPEGLRTVEVWGLVAARLGQEIPYSAIKGDLAVHAKEGGCFERLRRGVYRLK